MLDRYELRCLDLSNPTAPTVGGKVTLRFFPDNFAMSSSLACISAGYGAFAVVDISMPEDPLIQLQTGDWDWISGMTIENNLLYQTTWRESALRIYDLSNPNWPQHLGSIHLRNAVWGGSIARNGYVYAGGTIVDVRDPARPRLIGSMPAGGGSMAFADGKIFLGGPDGLKIMPAQCDR